MPKGIIYITSTIVNGLIKIGKCQTDQYDQRMYNLEHNGYCNVVGLKRKFAIEVEDYDEKEKLLHTIFKKSQVGDSELFSIDLDLAIQLLTAFDGIVVFPKEVDKEDIFDDATIEIKEKENNLDKNRHHFKEIEFYSSLTCRNYKGLAAEDGTLKIIDLFTNQEVPNYSSPSKRAIVGQAIKDIEGSVNSDINTLYERYHYLTKILGK